MSAAFHALFPLEFDRAMPLFNCGAVELLLQEWNRTMNTLDDVSAIILSVSLRDLGGVTRPSGFEKSVL